MGAAVIDGRLAFWARRNRFRGSAVAMNQALVGGLTSGAIYALLGLGIIIVYNVSRFINLAQGEFYVYGALITSTLLAIGVPLPIAGLLAVGATALLAAATQRLVFSRLTTASHTSQLLAGIGVAIALAGLARVVWGTHERSLPAFWTRPPLHLFGARVSTQALVLFFVLAVLLGLLWVLFKRTLFGTRMRAVAALHDRAGLLAINVGAVTTIAFALAGSVGALAGVAVTPLVFVTYHSGLLLTIYGFIAAAFGNMRSVPLTVSGGLLIGVLESTMAYYGDSALKTPFAFVLLVMVLLYRASRQRTTTGVLASARAIRSRLGAAAPLPRIAAPALVERLTSVRASLIGVGVVFAFALLGPVVLSPYWVSLWSFAGVFVIVGIGLDLLLGYTGQLSLGQTTFMGISAYTIALSVQHFGVSAWAAVAIALATTLIFATILGLVVLRLSGYYFTLATLAIAIATEALAKGMPGTLGGPTGLRVRSELSLPGFALDSPTRLFSATWIVVALALVVALRLTRARTGRAMQAVGADEDVARATAIDPFSTKVKAFVISAGFAAVAGALYAHILMFVSPHSLGLVGGLDSIVGLLLGGFGTVWGALIGVPVVRLAPQLIERFATYQELVYGLLIVGLVLLLPDGIVGGVNRLSNRVGERLRRKDPQRVEAVVQGALIHPDARLSSQATGDQHASHEDVPEDLVPRGAGFMVAVADPTMDSSAQLDGLVAPSSGVALQAADLSKRFGGIAALTDVGISIPSGAIVGLIGPNGAGKSTCLSALAGSLRPDQGTVELMGIDVTNLDAASRAAAGLARTFQLPRIPHQMTVLDIAALGAYRRGSSGALRAVFGATGAERRGLERAGMESLEMTGIAHLHALPANQLSTGEQKMLEMARALASAPEVLLADEPAGGLFDEEIGRLGEVLAELARCGLAVVLVEHHMDLVMEVCSQIVVLNEGRVIAVGSPEDVQTNEEVLDAYLGV